MSRTPRAVAEGPPFQRRDRTRPDVVRNREQIRTAVGELFARDGLSVSMTAIRKTAGLSTSTLYRHYSTKAALVADVMLEPITAWTEAVAGVPAGPADDRLAAMLSASAEHQSKNLALTDLLTSPASSIRADIDDARRAGLVAIRDALRAVLNG